MKPYTNEYHAFTIRERRRAGEIIYFDLATLCEQARSRLKRFGPLRQCGGPEAA